MSVFENREARAMLIAEQQKPFNDESYIYEIKFDGIRCLAYINKDSVDLRNKRNKQVNMQYPELCNIYKQVTDKCILDGEIIVSINGKPDFHKVQKRALMTDLFKIEMAMKMNPATFIVYDILYYKDSETIDMHLMDRKKLINKIIKENQFIAISRIIEEKGIDLFNLTKQQSLEGVVAKRKDSKYFYGKRSKDWIKFKHMSDEDFIICGYIKKSNNMFSLVLGQFNSDNVLKYKGHVTLGSSIKKIIDHNPTIIENSPFNYTPSGNENAIWLKPQLVGIVEYMANDKNTIRQPVFKGVRNDKLIIECRES